jgi:hypothetical protein
MSVDVDSGIEMRPNVLKNAAQFTVATTSSQTGRPLTAKIADIFRALTRRL